MFLAKVPGADIRALISIHGKHEYALDAPGVAHRLDLQFDDVEVADREDSEQAYRVWTRNKWAAEVGRPLTAPTHEDAIAIIEFARTISAMDGTLLCQCHAGVSRSTAAALICLAAWTPEGSEATCMETLLRIRPCAAPHRGLIAFADAILKRGGRLLAAATQLTQPGQ